MKRLSVLLAVLFVISIFAFAAPALAGGPDDCGGDIVPGHCHSANDHDQQHFTGEIGDCEYVGNSRTTQDGLEWLFNVHQCRYDGQNTPYITIYNNNFILGGAYGNGKVE